MFRFNIIFDLDGTLIDIDDRWYSLHFDLSKIYKYKPLPKRKYIELKRNKISERNIIKKTNISPGKMNSYLIERINLIETRKYLRKDKLKPKVDALLKKLSQSYILILLTKRRKQRNCQEEINHLGIRKYFLKIIVASSISKDQAVRKFLGKSFYKKSLLIGDTEEDFAAAEKLGIKCILVCDGSRSREYLLSLKPDYIFNKINQINF
ncbi:HAD hydrolase-like protein [Candidatus Parcubacteria bacterium]|nr:HAD hydrolase-like protein [Candidatus Parcubacteria bacterium]